MKSYNLVDLQHLATEMRFIRDNLEKVIRLTDILQFIQESSVIGGQLVLKGGTAINLTVFELPRLSVDIDLDFHANVSRQEMLLIRASINHEIISYMSSEGYVLNPHSKNPHSLDSWVFNYVNAGGNKDNIKIEINYSMRHHILPVETRHIVLPFFDGLSITTLAAQELFSSKIKALVERAAARDLYDVYNMLHSPIFECFEDDLMRKCVLFYMAVGGKNNPSVEIDLSAIDSLQFKQIRAQLLPMLRHSEFFDFQKAKQEIKEYLSQLLVFNEEERDFINHFNSKNYRPDLLFDDPAIVNHIAHHPMALWKVR